MFALIRMRRPASGLLRLQTARRTPQGAPCRFFGEGRDYSATSSNMSLPTPQTGQTQSSGISSNCVPGRCLRRDRPLRGRIPTHKRCNGTFHFFWFLMRCLLFFVLRAVPASVANIRSFSGNTQSPGVFCRLFGRIPILLRLLFHFVVFRRAVASGGHKLLHEAVGIRTRDVQAVFVNVGDLHEVFSTPRRRVLRVRTA